MERVSHTKSRRFKKRTYAGAHPFRPHVKQASVLFRRSRYHSLVLGFAALESSSVSEIRHLNKNAPSRSVNAFILQVSHCQITWTLAASQSC
jgi:hypothetical protein